MLKTFQLKNGLKVATYAVPQMRSAFVSLTVKGGSIFDTKETSGTAHFMEHILVQGIPSFPNVESLSNYVEKLAGNYSASTSTQSIRFTITSPATYLSETLKIAEEVFFAPLFPEDSIERERQAVLEEIYQRQDALWYKNNQFFQETRFAKNHPLLLDPGGSRESVLKLNKKDLMRYWGDIFYPKNAYLVVVGGFNGDKIRKLIDKTFSQVPSKKSFPGFPRLSNKDLSSKTIAIRFDPNLQTCYLDISFPTISESASLKQRITLGIVKALLGNLRSSRLYRLLRQRRGLVYHVGFGSSLYDNFGFAYISSQVNKENLEEVIRLINAELSSFVKLGPTKEELEAAKNYAINQSLMQFDHPSGISSWIEGDLIWEEKNYTPEEYAKLIAQVSLDDVLELVQKNFEFAKLNVVVQGPVENSAVNRKKIASLVSDLS